MMQGFAARTLPTGADHVNLDAMSIFLALADYDGKQVAILEDILSSTPASAATLDELITLATSPEAHVAGGATWLLRRYIADTPLSPNQTATLVARLPAVTDEWARLHLCQSARFIAFTEADADGFADFTRECLGSERPFLRAWATDALHILATRHGKFGAEAARAIEDALSDEAASVRARARRIMDGR